MSMGSMRRAAMETETMVEPGQIEATLNYLAPGIDSPFTYTNAPPPGQPQTTFRVDAQRVSIRNGRKLSQMSLDREGFLLQHRPSKMIDFHDAVELKNVYYREIERLVAKVTGAS